MFFKYMAVIAATILAGCAGVKHSFHALIEPTAESSAISLTLAQTREVLVVSNGFPGWWGMYPTVISAAPEVASVTCSFARSWFPFRAPGLVLGGEVCQLSAHRVGQTWLLYGNKYTLDMSAAEIARDERAVKVIVTGE